MINSYILTLLITLLFVLFVLLLLFITNPSIVIYEISKDNTITKVKGKMQIVGNYIYGRKNKKVWLIPEGYNPFIMKRFFGTSKIYYVNSTNPVAVKIEDNFFKTEPINPQTLGAFYENKIITDLLKSVKAEALNYKIIIILALALVGVILAYFLFVAPNQIPKEAIPQLTQVAKDNVSVMMP